MLQLDLPTLNVLTKIDKIADRDPLPFNLDFYTDVQDLNYLLPYLEAEQRGAPLQVPTDTNDIPRPAQPDIVDGDDIADQDDESENEKPVSRYHALNLAITSLISDFALVGFEPLFIEDKSLMASLLHTTDRASGYAFGGKVEGANETVWNVAVSQEGVRVDIGDVQERWIERRDEFDELEKKKWEEEGRRFRGDGGSGGGDAPNGDGAFEQEQPVDEEMEALMRDQALRRGVDIGGITVRRVGERQEKEDT